MLYCIITHDNIRLLNCPWTLTSNDPLKNMFLKISTNPSPMIRVWMEMWVMIHFLFMSNWLYIYGVSAELPAIWGVLPLKESDHNHCISGRQHIFYIGVYCCNLSSWICFYCISYVLICCVSISVALKIAFGGTLGIEFRSLHMVCTCSTTEIHFQIPVISFNLVLVCLWAH